jgi:protein-S-isoprenylcysteine O-methyltransferase Ste14
MMAPIGSFFFKYRNYLAPIVFALMALDVWPIFNDEGWRIFGLVAGITVAVCGQALRALTIGLAYIKRGGRGKQVYADTLVQEGVFAHSRNPLYVGNFLIVTGVGLAANSLLFILIGLPIVTFGLIAMICAEEAYLRNKFGEQFDEYCRRVNRLLPNFSGLQETMNSMEFNWQRLVAKEYGTAYWWTAGLTLLILKSQYQQYGRAIDSRTIWILVAVLAVLTLGFLTAWFFKKTKRLRAP